MFTRNRSGKTSAHRRGLKTLGEGLALVRLDLKTRGALVGLQSRFTDWITRYETSLTALDESRRKEMEAADLDLRARWRSEREQAQREKDAT